jgi:hypothetical protein
LQKKKHYCIAVPAGYAEPARCPASVRSPVVKKVFYSLSDPKQVVFRGKRAKQAVLRFYQDHTIPPGNDFVALLIDDFKMQSIF